MMINRLGMKKIIAFLLFVVVLAGLGTSIYAAVARINSFVAIVGGADETGNVMTVDVNGAASIKGTVDQGVSATSPNAWTQIPVQSPTLLNSSTTGAANSAVAVTLTATPNVRNMIRKVSAYCSAGSANLTIADGGTTIFNTPVGAVGTSIFDSQWNPGLASTTGNVATITLGACGVSNTGTLIIQADRG